MIAVDDRVLDQSASSSENDAMVRFQNTYCSWIKYYQPAEDIEAPMTHVQVDPTVEAQEKVEELLQELREG